MRVISRKKFKEFYEKPAEAEQPLKAWFHETKQANWKSCTDLRARHRSADFPPGNRVALNLKGNTDRLIVRRHFNTGIAFIRFFGTHADYGKIDAPPSAYSPAIKPKVLKTERDYQAGLAYVECSLLQPAADEAELKRGSLLVENYEEFPFPIATPAPIAAIRFQLGHAGRPTAGRLPYLREKARFPRSLTGSARSA